MRPGPSRAVCGRQLHEVGIMQLGAIDAPLEPVALVPHDIAERIVVKDDAHGVDFMGHGGGQFLGVEQKAAIAGDGDNRGIGPGDFGAESRRIRIPEIPKVR